MNDTLTHQFLDDFREINPLNYGDDDVNALNVWAIAAHTLLSAALAQQAEPTHYLDAMGLCYTEARAKFIGRDVESMVALYAAPQVTQQAEQGWVLLDDGLPQPHQMVLVARGKFVTTGSYSPKFGWEWEQLDGEDADSVATHWMPLPTPPKGGGGMNKLTEIKPSAMTADQLECYELFCDLVGGEHHITGTVFGFGHGIKCSMFSGQLSTFDFDYLTRLVLMAHDRCIRAEIMAGGPGRVGIALHRRHTREGSSMVRHPTIEQAIVHIRKGRELA